MHKLKRIDECSVFSPVESVKVRIIIIIIIITYLFIYSAYNNNKIMTTK